MTLALTGTILITTKTWDPIPKLNQWWAAVTALSKPAPAWTKRLGGSPDVAAVMPGNVVVVASRGFVEAYQRSDGKQLWRHDAYWALPGGDIVVMRQRPSNPDQDRAPDRGYAVLDPVSGAVIWSDREATSVWVFADVIVDLTCPDGAGCTLRSRRHHGNGGQIWAVPVSGNGRTISGPNPPLAGTRDPAGWFADAAAGSPGPLPPVIGVPIDGVIHVIDTQEGRQIREARPPDRQSRLAFSGERLLLSRSGPAETGCRQSVEAFHYRTEQSKWRKDGNDLDTASGAGCEQRRDPLGSGGYLVAIRPDSRPVLIFAEDGSERWTGVAGERVLATDGLLAVVEGADRKTVKVIDLNGDNNVVWSGLLGLRPEAAVTPDLIILRDTDKGRLIVLSHSGAKPLGEWKTETTVVGYGADAVIIARARTIGLLTLTPAA